MAETLTHDELVVACRNVGVDLKCGACAEVFYTGVTLAPHDCLPPPTPACNGTRAYLIVQRVRLLPPEDRVDAYIRAHQWAFTAWQRDPEAWEAAEWYLRGAHDAALAAPNTEEQPSWRHDPEDLKGLWPRGTSRRTDDV